MPGDLKKSLKSKKAIGECGTSCYRLLVSLSLAIFTRIETGVCSISSPFIIAIAAKPCVFRFFAGCWIHTNGRMDRSAGIFFCYCYTPSAKQSNGDLRRDDRSFCNVKPSRLRMLPYVMDDGIRPLSLSLSFKMCRHRHTQSANIHEFVSKREKATHLDGLQ